MYFSILILNERKVLKIENFNSHIDNVILVTLYNINDTLDKNRQNKSLNEDSRFPIQLYGIYGYVNLNSILILIIFDIMIEARTQL